MYFHYDEWNSYINEKHLTLFQQGWKRFKIQILDRIFWNA